MESFGFTAIPAVTVICYLIAQAVKVTAISNKWLPVICGVAGALLGAAGLYVMPDYPAQDPITAVAIGIVSGLSATGMHQIYKQISRGSGCP